jgi:hypothetical protein
VEILETEENVVGNHSDLLLVEALAEDGHDIADRTAGAVLHHDLDSTTVSATRSCAVARGGERGIRYPEVVVLEVGAKVGNDVLALALLHDVNLVDEILLE